MEPAVLKARLEKLEKGLDARIASHLNTSLLAQLAPIIKSVHILRKENRDRKKDESHRKLEECSKKGDEIFAESSVTERRMLEIEKRIDDVFGFLEGVGEDFFDGSRDGSGSRGRRDSVYRDDRSQYSRPSNYQSHSPVAPSDDLVPTSILTLFRNIESLLFGILSYPVSLYYSLTSR